ncbi:uncharacterized protein LOC129780595 [Toxorhynchites rutilus septentrionalis]|uniref:uncharacterized protein LOC129780595 n=1 Tax=Toxorhynchites rutilus septentrionalis TaxID=329112 RepID=UPI00247AF046|nr:uncharacterized protein LOC129780595 [Toxorhynchites rutilus septentrionalis]
MEKANFCKGGFIAVLLLLGAVASSPLHDIEEAITVPTIQFLSKTVDQDVCTAYQVRGRLFVTSARCLGEDHSAIQQLTALDVFDQGSRDIKAFAIRGPESEACEDIALVLYNGPLGTESESAVPDHSSGFVAAFGLEPLGRFEREDDAEAAAAIIGFNLIGSIMALFSSMLLMK